MLDSTTRSLPCPQTALDPAGRQGRFIPWATTASRGDSPHPTMATLTQRASQLGDILRRAAKFLSAFASATEDDAASNEVDVDGAQRKEDPQDPQDQVDDETPGGALAGLYSECLLRLSVPCVQRKLLLFLDRLGRMERFRLLGDFLTVVRVEPRHGEARQHVLDEDADVTDLAGMVDRLVDDFFDTHVLRFSLPGTLRVGRSPKTTVDIHLDRPGGHDDDDEDVVEQGRAMSGHHRYGVVEGRGSIPSIGGGGNSKKKQKMIKKIKKKLMKLLMMLMSVMMVMGPMTGGMAGNTAGLALMLGTLALIILKAMIIKQMGGSVTQLFGNVGNSFGNLAGIPGLPGNQGQGTNYLPTGTGSGPYSRSDYQQPYQAYQPYTTWAARSADDSWFGGLADPMTLAYRAYSIATHLK
ncbi:uncharacterized protein LOC117653115 [Thrips palmi]|uniref:Uncharacterized protein LOC117653115 n=1 Tax=Thrips palmi TaxID=161013 RepID=A0A6P9AFM5_THRPL|nr:uncharacterized protein LOC117653115 [Thrips palmi]